MAEPGPQVQVPAPPPLPPSQDQAGQNPLQQLQGQPQQPVVHLSWSYFKPEFSGKPDEDAEAHMLCTKDWMNVHHFVDKIKVQRLFDTVRS